MLAGKEGKDAVIRLFKEHSAQWGQCYDGPVREVSDLDLVLRRNWACSILSTIEQLGSAKSRILDIGCGSGGVLSGLNRDCWNLFGFDLVEEMVREVAQIAPDMHVGVADALRIPLQDNSVDAVTCLGVLEYVEDWRAAIGAIRSVLKPGGHFIVSFPNRQSLFRRFSHVERRAFHTLGTLKSIVSGSRNNGRSVSAYPHREWTTSEAMAALEAEGFRVQSVHFNTYGFKGRFGDWSRLNLSVARRIGGKWGSDSILARRFAWTMVCWCVAQEKP